MRLQTLRYLLLLSALLGGGTVEAQRLIQPEVIVHSDVSTPPKDLNRYVEEFLLSYFPQVEVYLQPKRPIRCIVEINIKDGDGFHFKGDLSLSFSRPIYNKEEESIILIAQEKDLDIDIVEGAILPLLGNEIPEPPFLKMLYYYATLGVMYYYDSFAPSGGEPFFMHLLQHQSTLEQAWDILGVAIFPIHRGSYLAPQRHLGDLRSNAGVPYREIWYTYHRQALDSEDADSYVETLRNVLEGLKNINDEHATIGLLHHFRDTKSLEIVGHLTETELRDLGDLAQLLK